jgi:hypothetical protein
MEKLRKVLTESKRLGEERGVFVTTYTYQVFDKSGKEKLSDAQILALKKATASFTDILEGAGLTVNTKLEAESWNDGK